MSAFVGGAGMAGRDWRFYYVLFFSLFAFSLLVLASMSTSASSLEVDVRWFRCVFWASVLGEFSCWIGDSWGGDVKSFPLALMR